MAILSALARNSSFIALNAHGNTDEFVSKRKATALCHILCDKTSIKHTYSSNHTFATIWGDRYFDRETFDEYASLLDLNKNEDKMEIAREKILTTHFPNGSGDLHVFASMSENVLPFAIEWIGRNRLGSTLMFNFVRGFPYLFNVSHEATSEMGKKEALRFHLSLITMSIRGLITIEKINPSIRRCDMSERKGSLFEDMVH